MYFTSPTGDWITIYFTWLSKLHKGLAVCIVKTVPSFLSYVKTLSAGLAQGNEPATSHSAVTCVLRTRQVLSELNVNEEQNMLLIL